jgi:hypothetical protein
MAYRSCVSGKGEATVRLIAREIIRICGVAVVAAGLAAALALIFVPLGLERSATTLGFCGPGATSDNAFQVRIDPGIVNTGGAPGQAAPVKQQQQLEEFCTGEADTRLTEAAVTAAVALILGIGVPVLASKRNKTSSLRRPPPMQPWAPRPPSERL